MIYLDVNVHKPLCSQNFHAKNFQYKECTTLFLTNVLKLTLIWLCNIMSKNNLSWRTHLLTNLLFPSKFASEHFNCDLLKWVNEEWYFQCKQTYPNLPNLDTKPFNLLNGLFCLLFSSCKTIENISLVKIIVLKKLTLIATIKHYPTDMFSPYKARMNIIAKPNNMPKFWSAKVLRFLQTEFSPILTDISEASSSCKDKTIKTVQYEWNRDKNIAVFMLHRQNLSGQT